MSGMPRPVKGQLCAVMRERDSHLVGKKTFYYVCVDGKGKARHGRHDADEGKVPAFSNWPKEVKESYKWK